MQPLTLHQLPIEFQQQAIYQTLFAGQILFQQGEFVESIFFVEVGQIRLVTFTDHQTITYSLAEADEVFAEAALFEETFACTAIADILSRVAAIPKPLFLQVLHQSPQLNEIYLLQLSYRVSNLKSSLMLRSIRSARERLLHYLSQQVEADGKTIILRRSLKDLAHEIGLDPDVVSRGLTQLQRDGIINRQKAKIILSKRPLL